MSQSGYTPILIYSSATTTNVPLAANLSQGELAINTADGKLFYKDSGGVVQTIASKSTGTVAGSNTQVIYNSSGAYAGSANMTFDGSTLTTLNSAYTGTLTGGTGVVNLGSGQFYKDASGNVGIGTSSPATTPKLTISATIGTNAYGGIRLLSTTVYSNQANYEAFGRRADSNISSVFSGGVLLARVNTAPAAITTGMNIGRVAFGGSYDGTDANVVYGSQIVGVSEGTYSSTSAPTGIAFYTTPSGTAGALTSGTSEAGTERMRIDSSGNVGIGTSSPTYKLDVQGGGSHFSGQAVFDNTINLDQATLNNIYYTSAVAFSQSGTGERMRIDSGGNVGIGTASPAYKLDVTGVGRITGNADQQYNFRVQYGSTGFGLYQDDTIGYTRISAYDTTGTTYGKGLTFATATAGSATTERMRIDSSGRLLVGTTTPYDVNSIATFLNSTHAISAVTTATGGGWYALECGRTGSTGKFIGFTYPSASTEVGSISYNGTLTLYNQTSDQRLKENIVDAETAFETINKIKIRSFDWIESNVHETHGVIAQELQQIAPQCVTEGTTNEDGSMGSPWQVDTSPLIPLLTKAIQELKAIVDTQAEQIKTLQGSK